MTAFKKEMGMGCHAFQTQYTPAYGYVPSLAVGVLFVVLFGIPLLYHVFQSCRCPYNTDAFLAQEVTLIMAPVFFSAALYVLLGLLILDLGRASSFMSAKWYTIIFCSADLISLIVQAVGGAMASTADTDDQQTRGTHIMVAGIAFQLGTMTLFGGMLADFVRRIWGKGLGLRELITPRLKIILGAIFVSFLMIYIRSIYRTIELAQGWDGYLITHQGYFIGLDAAIMVIAVAIFIPVDPAVLMGKPGHGHGNGHGEAIGVKQVSGTDASDGEAGIPMSSYDRVETGHP
ncbi:hypothetical protein SLS53_005615 [Cytospora paraplurivora]|uniref:Uncharacterized protein n=1 Tax=Cytospora paraplurivora TaxID=2898453 RepID=A0AAN9YFY3_9PEZI